ncbi:MAG TPA: carbohydrate ABC transporter permease, partial [bacterium]|nr:carbohydrate ABC transporter permease [bacterium]
MNMRKKIGNILTYIGIACILVIVLFPILWAVTTSLKTGRQAQSIPPVWLFRPSFHNYIAAFVKRNFGRLLVNSLIVSLSATFLSVILGSLAGYALARFQIKGKNLILMWILSIRMFPPIAAIIPFFLLYNKLGLIDTRLGLIIAYTAFNLPFAVWIMQGFFLEVPRELDEAALIDGCSPWRVFFKIVLPLSAPGLVATAIFTLIFSWNEFMFALILSRSRSQTMPVGVM